jgi:hypothetical protein
MRPRPYRPENPGCLEGRLLLSGAAGLSDKPYVFSQHTFKFYAIHVESDFTSFARYRSSIELHREIEDVLPLIPYARADGLRDKIDSIVDGMVEQVHEGVPHAIRTANEAVIAVTRSEIQARVQAGDVVVK